MAAPLAFKRPSESDWPSASLGTRALANPGWLISKEVCLTAGHCAASIAKMRLHFLRSTSTPDVDQYTVNVAS